MLSDALSFAGFNLFGNGSAPITGKITGPSGAAENAAAHTKSAVSVRTGHAAVKSNLI